MHVHVCSFHLFSVLSFSSSSCVLYVYIHISIKAMPVRWGEKILRGNDGENNKGKHIIHPSISYRNFLTPPLNYYRVTNSQNNNNTFVVVVVVVRTFTLPPTILYIFLLLIIISHVREENALDLQRWTIAMGGKL